MQGMDGLGVVVSSQEGDNLSLEEEEQVRLFMRQSHLLKYSEDDVN